MKKENKSITVSKNKITVNYHDTSKHFTYFIQKGDPNRDIKLFGKEFKGVKSSEIKTDFLTPELREIFDDLVYARKRMTKTEIEKLPKEKKYRVTVLSKKVEQVLFDWRNQIVSKKVDSLLLSLFPNSPIVKQMVAVEYDGKENVYNNSINIHNIATEKQIAEYLAEKGLFPKFNK